MLCTHIAWKFNLKRVDWNDSNNIITWKTSSGVSRFYVNKFPNAIQAYSNYVSLLTCIIKHFSG